MTAAPGAPGAARGAVLEQRLTGVLPPYDGTAADCVIRLAAVVGEFSAMPRVIRDDTAVDPARPERGLARQLGTEWQPVSDWAQVLGPVRAAGPNAVAAVLVEPPNAPRHAFALLNDGGELFWVETQATEGRRVRPVGEPPELPVGARVIVRDGQGTPVPVTPAGTATVGALVDPASTSRYGMSRPDRTLPAPGTTGGSVDPVPAPTVEPAVRTVQELPADLVRVPANGRCLPYAVLTSAPGLVSHRLAAAELLSSQVGGWLAEPDDVRAAVGWHAEQLSIGAVPVPADAPLGRTADALIDLVAGYLTMHRDALPSVIPEVRQALADRERVEPDTVSRADRIALLERNGFTDLTELTDDDLRTTYLDWYAFQAGPLTDQEFDVLLAAVRDWSRSWSEPVGVALLPLLAYALDVSLSVRSRVDGQVRAVYGPADAAAVSVYHNDRDHFDASSASSDTPAPADLPATDTPDRHAARDVPAPPDSPVVADPPTVADDPTAPVVVAPPATAAAPVVVDLFGVPGTPGRPVTPDSPDSLSVADVPDESPVGADLDGTYGPAVRAARITPEERDDTGDVRLNPLWYRLADFPAHLLDPARARSWRYVVAEDGEIYLGAADAAAAMRPRDFRALLAGMRQHDPELTAERLREQLGGQGHAGLAVGFDARGRAIERHARVGGELTWNESARRWQVDDRSAQYMGVTRPTMDPAEVQGWLGTVAAAVGGRLDRDVIPVRHTPDDADPVATVTVDFAPGQRAAEDGQLPELDLFVDQVVAQARRAWESDRPRVVRVRIEGGGNGARLLRRGAARTGRRRAASLAELVGTMVAARLRAEGIPPRMVWVDQTSRGAGRSKAPGGTQRPATPRQRRRAVLWTEPGPAYANRIRRRETASTGRAGQDRTGRDRRRGRGSAPAGRADRPAAGRLRQDPEGTWWYGGSRVVTHDVPGRPGSIALLSDREWRRMARNPRLPAATDGVTVLVHGAGDRFRVPLRHPDGRTGEVTLSVDELHTMLESPERDGRRLALLSCAAGRLGARSVQRLADLRDTDVYAPEGDLVVAGTTGHLPVSVDGRPWALFVPDGTGAWDVVNDEIVDPDRSDAPFAVPFAGYASRAGDADPDGVRLTNTPPPPTGWDRIRIIGDGLCLLSAVAVAAPEAMADIAGMPADAVDRLLRVRRAGVHDTDLTDIDRALRDEILRRVADPSPAMVELFNQVATTWLFPVGYDVRTTLLDAVDTWDWQRLLPGQDDPDDGGRVGDVLPLVIGAALGRPVWQGRLDPPSVTVLWPDGDGTPVRLLYNGHDHYDAWVPDALVTPATPAGVPDDDGGRTVDTGDSGKEPNWPGVASSPKRRGVLWPWDGEELATTVTTLIRQVDAVDLPGQHLLVLLADAERALLLGGRVLPEAMLDAFFAGGHNGGPWAPTIDVDPRAPLVLTVVSDDDANAVAFGRSVERELRRRLDVGQAAPAHLSVVVMQESRVPTEPVRMPRLRFRLPVPPAGQLSRAQLAGLPERVRQAYVALPDYTAGDPSPAYERLSQDQREQPWAAAQQATPLRVESTPPGPVRRVTVADTGLADGLGGHRGWLLRGGWPSTVTDTTGAAPVELTVAAPADTTRLVRLSLPAVEDQPALEVDALVEPPAGASLDVEPRLITVVPLWRNDFVDGPVAQPITDPPEMVRRAWQYVIEDTEQTETAGILAERSDQHDDSPLDGIERRMLRARVLAAIRETFWETFGDTPAYAAGLAAFLEMPEDTPLADYWQNEPVRELILRRPWQLLSGVLETYVDRYGWQGAHRIVVQPGRLDAESSDALVTPDGTRYTAADYLARLPTTGGTRVLFFPDLDHAAVVESGFIQGVRASAIVVLPTLLPADVHWIVLGASAVTGAEVSQLVDRLDGALARATLHAADPVEGRELAQALLADPALRIYEDDDWLAEIFDSGLLATPTEPVRLLLARAERGDVASIRTELRQAGVLLIDPAVLPRHRVLIEITDPRPELVQSFQTTRGGTRWAQFLFDGRYAADHPDTWRVISEPWSRIQSWLAVLDPGRTYPWDQFLLAMAHRDQVARRIGETPGAWPGAGHRFAPVSPAALAQVQELFAGRSTREGVIWTESAESQSPTLLLVDAAARGIVDHPLVYFVPQPPQARAVVTIPQREDLSGRGLVVATGQLDGDRLTGDGWEVTADEVIASEALRAHPRVVLLDRSPPEGSPFVERLLERGVGVLAPDADLAGWTAVYQLPGWQLELTGPDSADLLRELRHEFDAVVLSAAEARRRTPTQTALVRAVFDLLGRPYGQEVVDGQLHLPLDRWASAEAFAAEAGHDGLVIVGGSDQHQHELTLRVPVDQVRVFQRWSGEELHLVTVDPATIAPVTDFLRDRIATGPVVRWTPDLGRAARAADVGQPYADHVMLGGLSIPAGHVDDLIRTIRDNPSWRGLGWAVDPDADDDAQALVWLGAEMAAMEFPVDAGESLLAVGMPASAVPAADRYGNGVVLWSPGRSGLPDSLRAAARVAVVPLSELDDIVDGVRAGFPAADAVAVLKERLPEGTRIIVVPGEVESIAEIPEIFDAVFAVVTRSTIGDPGTWTAYAWSDEELRIGVLTGADLSYVIAGVAATDPTLREQIVPAPTMLALPQAAVRFLADRVAARDADPPIGHAVTDIAFVAVEEISADDRVYTLPEGSVLRVMAPGPDGEHVLHGWFIDGDILAEAGHDILGEEDGTLATALPSQLTDDLSYDRRLALLELARLVGVAQPVTENPLRQHGIRPADRTFVPDWTVPVGPPVGPAWWVGADVSVIEITSAPAGRLPARRVLAWEVTPTASDTGQPSDDVSPPQLVAVPYRDGPLLGVMPDQVWAWGLGPLLGERGVLVEPGAVSGDGVTTGRPDGRGALPADDYRAILPDTAAGLPVVVLLDTGTAAQEFAGALAARSAVVLVRTGDGQWQAHRPRPGTGVPDVMTGPQAYPLFHQAVAAVTADLAELAGAVNDLGQEWGGTVPPDGVTLWGRLSGLPTGTLADRAARLASALFGMDRLRAAVDGPSGEQSVGRVLTHLGLPGAAGQHPALLARRLHALQFAPVPVTALGLLPDNAVALVWLGDAVVLVHRAPDGTLTLVRPQAESADRLTALDPDGLTEPPWMLLARGRLVAVRVASGHRVLGGAVVSDPPSYPTQEWLADQDPDLPSDPDQDPSSDPDQDRPSDADQDPSSDADQDAPSDWEPDQDASSDRDSDSTSTGAAGTEPGPVDTTSVSTGSTEGTTAAAAGPSPAALHAVGEALRRLPAARLHAGQQDRPGRPTPDT
ncbi:toxin glutamine deamidase domain-containing protein [Micromonospora humida]|uniref:toxin glutamine deamidase domain-containing protein n=1 Tax=Micromonospora humida TaxID=2809018 RepID=UPI003672E76C